MKKIIFLMCVVCMCSCTNSELENKKIACQELCDSLSAAQIQSWTVIESKDISWTDSKKSVMMVGTVPVAHNRKYQANGCLLMVENGQQILTQDYLHVPIGSEVIQRPIYVPEVYKDNGKKAYRPCIKDYNHYLVSDGKGYPRKNYRVN